MTQPPDTSTEQPDPPASTGYRIEALLADGRVVSIRSLEPDDGKALRLLHDAASDSSLYFRFFSLNRSAAQAYVEHVLKAPRASRSALVAVCAGEVVGFAVAERLDWHSAEISFLVSDNLQGLGVGTLLLEHLAARQHNEGVVEFIAEVLSTNTAMLHVLRDAGFTYEQENDSGSVTMHLSTESTATAVAAADSRERKAERASLRALFQPSSVAVAGAGRDRGGVGRETLENIGAHGFTGRLYAVNPAAEKIGDVTSYASFAALPEVVDLAVIAVPAEQAVEVAREAGRAGTRVAVVLSNGFSESSAEGERLQRLLLEDARRHGMRLIGPNCLGVAVNHRDVRLDATFASCSIRPGGLAIASQSGGVGMALLDAARRADLGAHSFVSLGNKADVSGNDLLMAWTDDDEVTAGALYLESFGNPRKFARLARRFAERKPLFTVVGGRSESGRRAGASYTSVGATPDVAIDALLAHSGIIQARDMDDLVNTAKLLGSQPLPVGPRLAVVGNAGGMGILAADAAHENGLVVTQLSRALQGRLRARVQGAAGVANPIDVGAAATAEGFQACLTALLPSGEVDAVLVMVAETAVTDVSAILTAIETTVTISPGIPVAVCPIGDYPTSLGAGTGLTFLDSCEAATLAFAHAARYAAWREAPAGELVVIDPSIREEAQELIRTVVTEDGAGWLSPETWRRLLTLYGVPCGVGIVASSASEAVEAAEEVGYPVVLKVADPGVVHKTEAGLVAMGLEDAAQVKRTYRHFAEVLGRDHTPVLVESQARGGVELALGSVRDPSFGPLVTVGFGGATTDVWNDRIYLLPPVTDLDANRALRKLRIWPLLQGFRGAPAADVAAATRVVQAVARLVVDVPEIAELDLNPVIAQQHGVICVDAKIRLTVVADSPDQPYAPHLRDSR